MIAILNFIKSWFIMFVLRNTKVVKNIHSGEYYILACVSSNAMVVLTTSHETRLPLLYKTFKDNFETVTHIYDKKIDSTSFTEIFFESGISLKLEELNCDYDFDEVLE